MNPLLHALLMAHLVNLQRQHGKAPNYQVTQPWMQNLIMSKAKAPFTMSNGQVPYQVQPISSPIPNLEDVSSEVKY